MDGKKLQKAAKKMAKMVKTAKNGHQLCL